MNRFYIGSTQVGYEKRILHHNLHSYGAHKYTASASDWILHLWIPTTDIYHAIKIEKKIKLMKSSSYICNLVKYPELREKIYNETSG